jgi:Tol biopolymer transport system component
MKRLIVCCALLSILIVVLPPVCARQDDSGGEILFYAEPDGNPDIYVINADRSDLRRLTDHPAFDVAPAGSPDGTIAFLSDRDDPASGECFPDCNFEIYVMDANGDHLRRLTHTPVGESHIDWSPDGTQIAYMSRVGSTMQIFVVQRDGTGSVQLTDEGRINEDPLWSADGTQIVFQSNRDGNFEIYVMNADGSDQQRITHNRHGDFWPSWCPVANKDL